MTAPLRVGFNLAYLVEDSGGAGTYARELLPALKRLDPTIDLTAWVGSTAPDWIKTDPWTSEVRWNRLPVPGNGTPWHLWYELAGIGTQARREKSVDVLHGLANAVPVVPFGGASVVTILDVIWIHHPDAMDLRARTMMGLLVRLCGRLSDRIVAISEAAAADISQTLGIPGAKFDVTPLGITQVAVAPAAELEPVRRELGLGPEPIVLCVAAKRAHKNLDGLIRALALVQEPRAQLVFPGSPSSYESQLRALAAELGLQDRVHFPGWVSTQQLDALYALADCFVLPSFQEGFGLPVLEAMRHGVPVACSGVSSLPEVVGDAALLFNPWSPESIATTIGQLLSEPDLGAELVSRGRARTHEFTWQRTAERTLESYHRAIAQRRR